MADFEWVEGATTVKEIVKAISTSLAISPSFKWTLVQPATLESITDRAILKTKTTFGLEAFLKLERPTNVLNHMLVTIGNKFDSALSDIDTERCSASARFAWHDINSNITLFDWASIKYWMNFSKDCINLVIQGDPSLDIAPYESYLISYAYIGALKGFEGADADKDYNFGLTASSDIFPSLPENYGKRTATCVTDIGMLGTRTGTPFQAHLPKFSAITEFADKHIITAGQWTHKFPVSDIVAYHAYDGDRGKFQNVVIGDRSGIFHTDILKYADNESGTEQQFQMFHLNAPYSIINNSPNVFYSVALRKS